MSHINSVAVIGLGAIGALMARQIQLSAPDTELIAIADGERALRLRSSGVTINGEKHIFNIAEPHEGHPVDLLIFAVKIVTLNQAIAAAKNFVGRDTILLPLENGISSERIVSEAFKDSHTLYSYAVGTDSTWVGQGIRATRMYKVPFGDAVNIQGAYSQAVKDVRDFFERAAVSYEIPEDMIRSQWWKFMMNIGINQTCALLRGTYELVSPGRPGESICRDLMLEAVNVANAMGISLKSDDVDDAMAVIHGIGQDGKPSTLQDIEARRKTEIESLSGDLLRIANEHHVNTPLNTMAYRVICAIEDGYLRENAERCDR